MPSEARVKRREGERRGGGEGMGGGGDGGGEERQYLNVDILQGAEIGGIWRKLCQGPPNTEVVRTTS